MTDDFFGELMECDENQNGDTPEHLLLAAIQYAIRTNLQLVSLLTRDDVMDRSTLIPRQVNQILIDAYRNWESRHPVTESLRSRHPLALRPVELHLRGVLHGIEIALCTNTRSLDVIKQNCMDALKTAPINKTEQARLQGLINKETDMAGIEDRNTRRTVGFSVIRLFALSGQDGRRLTDTHWRALTAGMLRGLGEVTKRELAFRSLSQKAADSDLRISRGSDLAQATIASTKDGLFPTDSDYPLAWALATCDATKATVVRSSEHGHAVECMMQSYALPLVMAVARGMFELACEADGMTETEVTSRLATAMYANITSRMHDTKRNYLLEGTQTAMVQFDVTSSMSGDLISAVIYGMWWLCGYASQAIGWLWEPKKAREHRDCVQGRQGTIPVARLRHYRDMQEGYEAGWFAGGQTRARIHRLTTTRQLHAIEEEFSSKALPVAEKIDRLGYAGLFLLLPVATPDLPWLLS